MEVPDQLIEVTSPVASLTGSLLVSRQASETEFPHHLRFCGTGPPDRAEGHAVEPHPDEVVYQFRLIVGSNARETDRWTEPL